MQAERSIFFHAGKKKGTTTETDMMKRYASCKGDNARLTSWPPALWLHVLCHLIQSLQNALLALGNQVTPAVLSKLGNVPT